VAVQRTATLRTTNVAARVPFRALTSANDQLRSACILKSLCLLLSSTVTLCVFKSRLKLLTHLFSTAYRLAYLFRQCLWSYGTMALRKCITRYSYYLTVFV